MILVVAAFTARTLAPLPEICLRTSQCKSGLVWSKVANPTSKNSGILETRDSNSENPRTSTSPAIPNVMQAGLLQASLPAVVFDVMAVFDCYGYKLLKSVYCFAIRRCSCLQLRAAPAKTAWEP